MSTMPPDITYGHVTGRIVLAVADGADEGRLPDARPAVGTVVFTPRQKAHKVGAPDPATVLPLSITCTLDPSGVLIDDQGAPGVWLIAGVYGVSYKFTGASLSSHDISVTEDHTLESPLDLTLAMPPAGAPLAPSQFAELASRIDRLTGVGGGGGSIEQDETTSRIYWTGA